MPPFLFVPEKLFSFIQYHIRDVYFSVFTPHVLRTDRKLEPNECVCEGCVSNANYTSLFDQLERKLMKFSRFARVQHEVGRRANMCSSLERRDMIFIRVVMINPVCWAYHVPHL